MNEDEDIDFLTFCRIKNKEDFQNLRCCQKNFENMERMLDNALKLCNKEEKNDI
jgi:hypothetical protein